MTRIKVSSFQGLNEVNLFLITTCWICKKLELKILKHVSDTGILMQLNFKLRRTDKNLTSLRKNISSLLSVVFTASFFNKY